MVRVEGVGPERLADTLGGGGQREGGVKRVRETVLLTLCSSNSSNPPVSLHTGFSRGSAEQETPAHRGSGVQQRFIKTNEGMSLHTGGAGTPPV